MAEDFSFNCPRCGKEPSRGTFLGSQIWHTECLIEDLIEKFKGGTPRPEIEKTIARLKNKDIEQKVGLDCGWPEYQPQKTQEELDAEYTAELEAAAAKEAEEKERQTAEEMTAPTNTVVAPAAPQDAAPGTPGQNSQPVEQPKKVTTSIGGVAPATPVQSVPPVTAFPPIQQPMGVPIPPSAPPTIMPFPPSFHNQANLHPAPSDPTVRRVALAAMEICLKNMRKDIEFGKLLLKFIKEFDWKERKKSSLAKDKENNESDEEKGEETDELFDLDDEDKLKPFLVEN